MKIGLIIGFLSFLACCIVAIVQKEMLIAIIAYFFAIVCAIFFIKALKDEINEKND